MRKKTGLLLTVFAILACALFTEKAITADAALTGVIIADDSVFSGTELSVADWQFFESGGIVLKTGTGGNTVHFTKNYDLGNPFIARTPVVSSESVSLCAVINFTLKINEITPGKKFGFAFGIGRLDGNAGNDGSTFLYFENAGTGLNWGLTHYSPQNKTLSPSAPLPDNIMPQNPIEVRIELFYEGKLTVNLNSRQVYKSVSENEVVAEGYLGFTQSGNFTASNCYTDAELLNVDIINEYYDRPAAPLIAEADFENGDYNRELWFVKGYGLYVDDGKLVFDDAVQNSRIGSRFAYSNFELSYSISDAINTVREDPLARGGKRGATYWQAISFGVGGESVDAVASQVAVFYEGAIIYFDASRDLVTGERTGHTQAVFATKGTYIKATPLPPEYDFLSVGFSDTVNIKLSVLNGIMTLYMKTPAAFEYEKIYSYTFKNFYTPTGYVYLWGESNSYVADRAIDICSNYKIGNLRLINYDLNPNTVITGFTSGKPQIPKNYDYNDTWDNTYLLKNNIFSGGTNGGLKGWQTALIAAGSAVAAAGLVFGAIICRRKKREKA